MDGFLATGLSNHSAVASAQPRVLPRAAEVFIAVTISMLTPAAARAQALDPGDIAAGMRLFRQAGGCQLCHGWAGDGRKMDNQMPDGANLRETTLDRQNLILTIKCGRPGRDMPAFDKFAYSDGRCYGLKQADLKARNLPMEDPPATLAPNEIELLADFLSAKIIGKGPMDHAKCVEYWGSEVEACGEFPK
jgi:mono/diheme cytochrome c family protein